MRMDTELPRKWVGHPDRSWGSGAGNKTCHALDVVGHREGTDGPERERDLLRSAARRSRNRPLTCGDAVLGDRGRRSGVASLYESKRAQSEPSCQRAPTLANDCG